MKKFILHIIVFLLVFLLVLHLYPLYLLYTGKYRQTVAGSEIYYSIDKSKQKKKTKKVLLGDSVGNQLFSNKTHNDTVNSLACNQSIGVVGQFLLLDNYFKAGNEVDTVYLLFNPFSFSNNLDQVFTYHYFIKPFYTDEYRDRLTQTARDQLRKVPYRALVREPYVLTTNWAPDFVSKDKPTYTFLSPISIEYLARIKALTSIHHAALVIVPSPVNILKKPEVEKMDKREIADNGFTADFEHYFDEITYLPDNLFVDGTHFKNPDPYTDLYKEKFIR